MLFHKDVKSAPSVEKERKNDWRKMNMLPLHPQRFRFYYKTKSGRDSAMKNFLKKFTHKHIISVEIGMVVDINTRKEQLPFVVIEANIRNWVKFMQLFEGDGLQFGSGEKIEKPKKDKTNYIQEHKKCIKHIKQQLSRLSDKLINGFTKNMKLRDLLIKRVKRNTVYPISTIDNWFIDEVLK